MMRPMSTLKTKPRVLVVEDEADLRATIVSFLNLSGFTADGAGGLAEFHAWLGSHDCDLMVIDLGLPDGSGLSLVEIARERARCGIVIVTARGELNDRLSGYALGADQYLVKPVDLRELVAILTAIHDRLPPREAPWTLDVLAWQLTPPNGRPVRLTQSEMAVLKSLAQTPGASVPRAALAESLGFPVVSYDPRRMEIMFRRLRKKIVEESGATAPIETVHGQGYAFTAAIQLG